MEVSNAFLVKRKWDIKGILRYHISVFSSSSSDDSGPNHQIYAAGKFVLGHLRKTITGFKRSPDEIFYTESPEVLKQYQKDLERGKLKIVKSLNFPEDVLDSFMEQGGQYNDIIKNFSKDFTSLDEYTLK